MNTTNATEFTRAQPRLLGLCAIAGHLKREFIALDPSIQASVPNAAGNATILAPSNDIRRNRA